MKLSRAQRDMVLGLIIDPMPASVRGEFVIDDDFCASFGIKPKFWFPLDAEHSVETGSLHNALRAAIAGRKTANLALKGGKRLRVKLGRKADNARLILGKKGFGFSNADLLSADKAIRVKAFKRIASKQPLLAEEEDKRLSLAQKHALKDREYVDLMTDFAATPEAFGKEFEKPRNFDADALMPDVPEYYRRLVGALDNSTTLDAFIGGALTTARKELIARHPKAALRRIAFSALWQPLIPFDLLKSLKIEDVLPLLDASDPFSLLCGFELCRAQLATDPGFSDLGKQFLDTLLVDAKASDARCNLFSSCAMIATVKIRGKAKVSGLPLFWVRLAALAHAGVLTNALKGITDTEGFLAWASQNFYPNYLWTCAIDLHDAPRWNPEWLDPEYLYAELVGRVQGSIGLVPEALRPKTWIAALDTAYERLKVTGKRLAANFPGPFDDFRETTVLLSSNIDVFKDVEAELGKATKLSDVPGLFALAGASQPSDHVVANVRRILEAPLEDNISDKAELMYLRLCARIGRITRNEPIANSVVARCIYIARRPNRPGALTDIFEIMVEACAAYVDSDKYRAQIGEVATRLCFAIEDVTDLRNLLAIFDVLSTRDNKLAAALGRATAVAKTKGGR